jgi:hypothetical protein
MRELETRIAVRKGEMWMRWTDAASRVRIRHAIAIAVAAVMLGVSSAARAGTPQQQQPPPPPPPPPPPDRQVSAQPVAGDQTNTVKLELRVFDGSDEVTGECRVRLFPRGQRANDLPTTAMPGQAITATIPVGFYDAQAIREKKEQVVGLRWAEQLLVQRYPDEYGRHLEVINFKPGYGALQIRPAPESATAAKGWTGVAYQTGDATREVAKAVVGSDDLIFALAGGTYDIKLTMADKSTQWMREVEVPSDRTRLKTWTSGTPSPSR